MCAAPVGDYNTVELPVAFEDVVEQILVVAALLTFVLVVSAHNRPSLSFGNGSMEGGKVDFVERTVVDNDVDVSAPAFLVVQCIMLNASSHAVGLHGFYVRNHHARSEVGVFAEIFEVASVERRAVDVATGSEQDVFVAIARLFADSAAVEVRHLLVPSGSQASKSGQSRAGVVGPSGAAPLIPNHFLSDAVRPVGSPVFGDAEARHAR